MFSSYLFRDKDGYKRKKENEQGWAGGRDGKRSTHLRIQRDCRN